MPSSPSMVGMNSSMSGCDGATVEPGRTFACRCSISSWSVGSNFTPAGNGDEEGGGGGSARRRRRRKERDCERKRPKTALSPRSFAECRKMTLGEQIRHSAKSCCSANLPYRRVPGTRRTDIPFAECLALGEVAVPDLFAEGLFPHSAKLPFAECPPLTLGELYECFNISCKFSVHNI